MNINKYRSKYQNQKSMLVEAKTLLARLLPSRSLVDEVREL